MIHTTPSSVRLSTELPSTIWESSLATRMTMGGTTLVDPLARCCSATARTPCPLSRLWNYGWSTNKLSTIWTTFTKIMSSHVFGVYQCHLVCTIRQINIRFSHQKVAFKHLQEYHQRAVRKPTNSTKSPQLFLSNSSKMYILGNLVCQM